jgi:hypothetical protein
VPGSDCRRWLLALCLDVFLRSRDARPAAAPESGDVDRDEDDASWKPATWSAVLAPRAPIES